LSNEVRKLSVFRHIAATIPATDHWFPVFQRYIGQIADRVDGFGGNSTKVFGNPDGTGKKPEDANQGFWSCSGRWMLSLLIAVAILLAASMTNIIAVGITLAVGIVVGLALYRSWCIKCQPSYCVRLQTIQLGLLVALGIIALMKLIGIGAQFSMSLWLTVGITAMLIQVWIFSRQCDPCKD
jgi:hypothetical protein